MAKEAIDTALAEASQLLVEVDEFAYVRERVVVSALRRRRRSKDVAQQGRVTSLLICHEFNQEAIFSIQSSSLEICGRELSETIVKEIKLNPFLIQRQSQRLVIEVRQRVVVWNRPVRACTTSWLVWDWLVSGLEQSVVIGICHRWQTTRRCRQCSRRSCQSSRDCWSWAIVWAMRSSTRHLATPLRRSRHTQRRICDLRGRCGRCESAEAQQDNWVGLHLGV